METFELPEAVRYRFSIDHNGADLVEYTAHVQPMVVVFFRHIPGAVANQPFDITTMRDDWNKPTEQLCRLAIQEAINADLFANPGLNNIYLKRDTAEWAGQLRRL